MSAPFPLHRDAATPAPEDRALWDMIWPEMISGLSAQTSMAYDPVEGLCFYRHPETGAACGVGQLMDDRDHQPDFEAHGVTFILDKHAFPHSPLLRRVKDSPAVFDALTIVQEAHDAICDGAHPVPLDPETELPTDWAEAILSYCRANASITE